MNQAKEFSLTKVFIPLFLMSYGLAFIPVVFLFSLYFTLYSYHPLLMKHGLSANALWEGGLGYALFPLGLIALIVLVVIGVAFFKNLLLWLIAKEKTDILDDLTQPRSLFKYGLGFVAAVFFLLSVVSQYYSMTDYLLILAVLLWVLGAMTIFEGFLYEQLKQSFNLYSSLLKTILLCVFIAVTSSSLEPLGSTLVALIVEIGVLYFALFGLVVVLFFAFLIKNGHLTRELVLEEKRQKYFISLTVALAAYLMIYICFFQLYYMEEYATYFGFDSPIFLNEAALYSIFYRMICFIPVFFALTIIKVRVNTKQTPAITQSVQLPYIFMGSLLGIAFLMAFLTQSYNHKQIQSWQENINKKMTVLQTFQPLPQLTLDTPEEGTKAELYIDLLKAKPGHDLYIDKAVLSKKLPAPEQLLETYQQPLHTLHLVGQYQTIQFPPTIQFPLKDSWNNNRYRLSSLAKALAKWKCQQGDYTAGQAYLVDMIKMNYALIFAMNTATQPSFMTMEGLTNGLLAFSSCIQPAFDPVEYRELETLIHQMIARIANPEFINRLSRIRLLMSQYLLLKSYSGDSGLSHDRYYLEHLNRIQSWFGRLFYPVNLSYTLDLLEKTIQQSTKGRFYSIQDWRSTIIQTPPQIRHNWKSMRNVQNSLLTVLTRIELEKYYKSHHAYPKTLNELKMERPNLPVAKKKLHYALTKTGYYLGWRPQPGKYRKRIPGGKKGIYDKSNLE